MIAGVPTASGATPAAPLSAKTCDQDYRGPAARTAPEGLR